MYKNFFFDMGNTLTDTADIPESFSQVSAEGIPADKLRMVGAAISIAISSSSFSGHQGIQPSWQDVFSTAFDQCGIVLSGKRSHSLATRLLERFNDNCHLKKHSVDILKTLREQNKKIILVSNVTGPVEIFYNQLRRLEIHDFFHTIIWSSEVGFRKPSPEIFRIALDRSESDQSESVFIGDSENADIGGALNMGMDAILLTDKKGIASRAKYCMNQRELLDFCRTGYYQRVQE